MEKQDFKNWLESQAGELIGFPNNWEMCPIAQWLKSKSSNPDDIKVLRATYTVDGTTYRELSKWAQRFTNIIDSYNGLIDRNLSLYVLELVTQEVTEC